MTTTNLSRTSLFGTDWKEVDDAEWKALDDDEYESEEEIYMTMDLGSNDSPAVLMRADACQLVGLDTPTPWLKVGNHVFKGIHDELMGSEILFKTEKDPQDPLTGIHHPIGSTSRRITFRPMVPRSQNSPHEAGSNEQQLMDGEEPSEEPHQAEQNVQGSRRPSHGDQEAPLGYTKAGKPRKRRARVAHSAVPLYNNVAVTEAEMVEPTSVIDQSDSINPHKGYVIPDDGLPPSSVGTTNHPTVTTNTTTLLDYPPGLTIKEQKKMASLERSIEAEMFGDKVPGRKRGTGGQDKGKAVDRGGAMDIDQV